jgi:hypothetical protein
VIGLKSLPTAIVYDLVKLPYYLTRIAVVLSRSKYKRKKAENKVINEILESLSISLEIVLKIIARLSLETPEVLQR